MSAVLVIDTSTDACSVALATDHGAVARHRVLPRAHNRHILSMIDEVLEGQPLSSVAHFACGVGPGSFTGLRIAASVVQGLGWSLDRPVSGFCSLQAQARSALASLPSANLEDWVLSTTDAQIGQVYWRLFRRQGDVLTAVGEPQISVPEAVQVPDTCAALSVVGSGAALSAEFKSLQLPCQWFPDIRPVAADTARWLKAHPEQIEPLAPAELLPRYVQQDIGWKKLSEQPRRD